MGERLGALLEEVWKSGPAYRNLESPLFVPVPLHRSRQRQRGFNQALAVARGLRRRLCHERKKKIPPIRPGLLVRERPTTAQTGLSLRKRHENVKGVFSIPDHKRVQGRDIVLIDDVMTTGATLASCAAALKAAGARTVLALAVSRATPEFPDLDDRASPAEVDGAPREWT